MEIESEKSLEVSLVNLAKERGGVAVKLTSQFHRGLPDRMVLLPGGRIFFVELKTTGRKPTLLQARTHERLRLLGFDVHVVDTPVKLQKLFPTI